MSINIDKLNKLNEAVTRTLRRRHLIILNPNEEQINDENLNENIEYDKIGWKIPEDVSILVNDLSQNYQLSNEDKILKVYEKLCNDYVYDDNLLSFIQKIDVDSYSLPDWYGRDIDEKWEDNRENHNRRVCYEVSRYLAQSLKELFKDNENYDICILWDKGLTHYFVGLTCDDYSITLDLDDFNNIKDLTRVKTDLTAEGIVIIDDKKGKMNGALDRFNEGKSKDAIKKIEHDIVYSTEVLEADNDKDSINEFDGPDKIMFLKNAIEILKEKYDIDSQGLFEYIKEIVDVTLGPESRKKVWKQIKGNSNEDIRYIRCLILDIDEQKYMIDVDQRLIRTFDEEEFTSEDTEFIPYKELLDDEVISFRSKKANRYDGR